MFSRGHPFYHCGSLVVLAYMMPSRLKAIANFYCAFTETEAKQTIKANQMAELKQQTPTFPDPFNQMSGTKQ